MPQQVDVGAARVQVDQFDPARGTIKSSKRYGAGRVTFSVGDALVKIVTDSATLAMPLNGRIKSEFVATSDWREWGKAGQGIVLISLLAKVKNKRLPTDHRSPLAVPGGGQGDHRTP